MNEKGYYTFVDIGKELGMQASDITTALTDYNILEIRGGIRRLKPEFRGIGYELEVKEGFAERFTEAGRKFIIGLL